MGIQIKQGKTKASTKAKGSSRTLSPAPLKIFLVQCAARFLTPTASALAVRETFGLDITPQRAATFDPTKAAGRNLSAKFVQLFHEERRKYLDDLDAQPLAHRNVRLAHLNDLLEQAKSDGDRKHALSAIDLARKELSEFDYVAPED